MYCPKCGKELTEGASDCTNCGTKLMPRQPIASSAAVSYASDTSAIKLTKSKKVSKKVIIAIILVAVILLGIISHAFINSENKETNTIMVYMVGSDLESKSGAASLDIMEMIKSGIDFYKNNVVVYAGGSTYWNLDISSSYNSLLELKEDGYEIVGRTDTPVNMGEAGTFADFLNICYKNYKTDHYSLICWNHGGGPLGGYGCDEIFDMDRLYINELYYALDNSPFNGDNKLDWIGFDACLMSSIEIADIMSSFANYMIASQETEPGCGWDYSFLSTYNKTSNTVKIAQSIIDKYADTVQSMSSFSFNPEVTLACLDLSMVDKTISAMDSFFGAMNEYLDMGGYTTLARNRQNTKAYGLNGLTSKGESPDLVDLYDLTDNVSSDYQSQANELRAAVKNMVIYERSNTYSSSGVSIYYPYDNELYYRYLGYQLCEYYERSKGYVDYISKFTNIWLNNSDEYVDKSMWSLDKSEATANEITMQMSKEQLENYSSVRYTILEEKELNGEKMYSPVKVNCVVEPDENGLIRISRDQILCVAEFGTSNFIIPLLQYDENGDEAFYKTVGAFLQTESNGTVARKVESVEFSLKEKNNELSILNISSSNENEGTVKISERSSLDIFDWPEFGYVYNTYLKNYDSNKNITAFNNWEKSSWLLWKTAAVHSSVKLEQKPTSELTDKYVCQIVINDCHDNLYASELYDLETYKPETKVVETENGSITYRLFDNYAEVERYDGEDISITISENINGKPVTDIASDMCQSTCVESVTLPDTITTINHDAFANANSLNSMNIPKSLKYIGDNALSAPLESIELPEGLLEIGDFAFCGSLISSITIPSTVEKIGESPFCECVNLAEIKVEKSKHFISENEMLLTKDKKTLISGVNTENIVIPKKVVEIAPFAFAGMDKVKHVDFVDSIEKIGNYAFYDCMLEEINLGSNVKELGNCAFAYYNDSYELKDLEFAYTNPTIEEMNIPKSLEKIGMAVFANRMISNFTVEEGSESFSADGMFLMNKAGTALYECSSSAQGDVVVPNTVQEIKEEAFNGCSASQRHKINTLTVPDSVVAIKCNLYSLQDYGLEELRIGKNVSIWNGYEEMLKNSFLGDEVNLKIIISKENKYFSVKGNEVVRAEENEENKSINIGIN